MKGKSKYLAVEKLNKKCKIHKEENLLIYRDEPRRSAIGEFCIRCTKG